MPYLIHLCLLLSLAAFSFQSSAALPSPTEAREVAAQYTTLRKTRAHYSRKTISIEDQSAEGAEATAYKDMYGVVQSIDVTYYGETGRNAYEIYFLNAEPVLVREQQSRYNAPIGSTEPDFAFDEHKTKTVQRFYSFKGAQLLRVVGPKVSSDSQPWDDAKEGQRIRELAKEVWSEFARKK